MQQDQVHILCSDFMTLNGLPLSNSILWDYDIMNDSCVFPFFYFPPWILWYVWHQPISAHDISYNFKMKTKLLQFKIRVAAFFGFLTNLFPKWNHKIRILIPGFWKLKCIKVKTNKPHVVLIICLGSTEVLSAEQNSWTLTCKVSFKTSSSKGNFMFLQNHNIRQE